MRKVIQPRTFHFEPELQSVQMSKPIETELSLIAVKRNMNVEVTLDFSKIPDIWGFWVLGRIMLKVHIKNGSYPKFSHL